MDDDSLHALLARGRLSGAQRERAFEGALRQSRRGTRTRWAVLAGAALLPLAAAAALLLRTPPTGDPATSSALVAKGADGPVLRATCAGRPSGECRPLDRLIFEVEGAKAPGFFAAYADCASGERIWYFPTAGGELPAYAGNGARTVIDKAARIGPEHGMGACKLHLFALERPLPRSSLVAGDVAGAFSANLNVEVRP